MARKTTGRVESRPVPTLTSSLCVDGYRGGASAWTDRGALKDRIINKTKRNKGEQERKSEATGDRKSFILVIGVLEELSVILNALRD